MAEYCCDLCFGRSGGLSDNLLDQGGFHGHCREFSLLLQVIVGDYGELNILAYEALLYGSGNGKPDLSIWTYTPGLLKIFLAHLKDSLRGSDHH